MQALIKEQAVVLWSWSDWATQRALTKRGELHERRAALQRRLRRLGGLLRGQDTRQCGYPTVNWLNCSSIVWHANSRGLQAQLSMELML
jgi:hypothetical protein